MEYQEDDVRPNLFQRGKKGTWTLRFWVPDRFRAVEPRKELFVSMKTSDWGEASAAALAVQQELMASLNARLLGAEAPGGREHYERVRDLALARGFAYRPAAELAAGPLEELLGRIESLARRDPQARDGAAVEAVLGGVAEPGLLLSGLFEEFERISGDKIIGKNDPQLRTWKNARRRAVKNLISVIGDKPIDAITPSDAVAFKIWWVDRLADDTDKASSPGTANSDMAYLGNMIAEVLRASGKHMQRPFSGMRLKKTGNDRLIAPFEPEWIREHLLCDNPIPSLMPEARDVLLVMVNTGCRPSEIIGLVEEDIFLDAAIPYIDINRKRRSLKTDASVRKVPLWGVSLEAMKRWPKGFPTYRGKGAGWSNTVNQHMRRNGLLPTEQHRAYSLRHSFEDRMTAARVDGRAAFDMMGHTLNRERYGAGASLSLKLEIIQQIAVTPDR